ncbi:hypothetical protein AQUCO_01800144v1 [Aquilegia coerulea]|uniref:F-box associated beta-propeller type 1 domain-containing protein n=1 Tax=Aquilegia coerulea TaxID=218851 RepID=A0A2G5DK79_AQUCA|nr:hypothetical protein AQUCO_01800144v1 [Aquilegia coerulea]
MMLSLHKIHRRELDISDVFLPFASEITSLSKHWCALISDPYFVRHYSLRNFPKVSGILLYKSSFLIHPEFDFISLDDPGKPAPFKSLRFVSDPNGIKIEQSCNGLLLCRSFGTMSKARTYYIYNPTTRQYTILPEPCGIGGNISSYIFVCVWKIGDAIYQLTTYSSYTTFWRLPRGAYSASDIGQFYNSGVFWNGAMHWISTSILYFDTEDNTEDEQQFTSDSLLCFDVETELFRTVSLPPKPVEQGVVRHDYFGASRDRLYLVETTTAANSTSLRWRKWSGMTWMLVEEAEIASLLLHTPGKIIFYTLKDKTLKTLQDLSTGIHEEGTYLQYWRFDSYQYIETLFCV